MTGRDIFKIWAPEKAKWTNWVRPVTFVGINENFEGYEVNNFTIPSINYIKKYSPNVAIFIDLPGDNSIKEGIAISKLGFRPIPIYNGTDEQEGAISTVDNKPIKIGLIKGALELKKIEISANASPAFLLDTNRMNRFKMNESVFDNSWDIYAQDIPSAEYFLKNDIHKIIVRSDSIQEDLKKILYKIQSKGLEIFFTDGYEPPKKVKINKPYKKEPL